MKKIPCKKCQKIFEVNQLWYQAKEQIATGNTMGITCSNCGFRNQVTVKTNWAS